MDEVLEAVGEAEGPGDGKRAEEDLLGLEEIPARAVLLADAVAAVEATLDSAQLRVDLERALHDAEAYLLLVLDTGGGQRGDTDVANGPRLVDKGSGEVIRLTVPDALARAERMDIVAL